MSRVTLVVVALAVVSCSSSGSSSGLSPAAKAKWSAYCDYRTACGKTTACPSIACMVAVAESAPLIEFVDCQTAKTCDMNDDACTASAGTTDAERQDFTARCEAAINSNPTTQTCYIEPVLCTIVAYPLFRKEIMRAVDACLPIATCEDRMPCIEAAVDPLNCT
jgi:hypothetical protein